MWVLIIVCVGVTVGLVMVYTLWLVVVVCGQLTGLSSWVVMACCMVAILSAGCGCRWFLVITVCGYWS